jgi:hypothetical protein
MAHKGEERPGICFFLVSFLRVPLYPDVPYANSPDRHDFYHVFNPRERSPIGTFMVAYKLTAAIFAEVILFSLVFFPVSGYVRAVAMGALDFYGGLHHSIVFLCAPVVITPLSYFLDHLPNFFRNLG